MNHALTAVANAFRAAEPDAKNVTVPLPFQKPLDAEKSLMIDLITERYEGAGAAQFSVEDTEDAVILHIPKVIRPMPVVLGRAS